MPNPTGRLARLLAPLILLGACSSDHGLHRTTQLLNNRLQTLMAPDIASGAASVQPLPDGAQVTLLGNSLFPNTVEALADRDREVRASVIQGLLDPSLLTIAVADTSTLSPQLREVRVRNVNTYFQDNGLGLSLLPNALPPVPPPGSAAAAAQGLTITILLDCPAHRQPGNWGTGPTIPSCY